MPARVLMDSATGSEVGSVQGATITVAAHSAVLICAEQPASPK
jgi:hypothetical protein